MQQHLDPGRNTTTSTMVATPAAIVKKGAKMNRFVTGLFAPRKKRNVYFIKMFCPDCNAFRQVTNTGNPCRVCGSSAITLAHNWPANLHAIPGGSAKNNEVEK